MIHAFKPLIGQRPKAAKIDAKRQTKNKFFDEIGGKVSFCCSVLSLTVIYLNHSNNIQYHWGIIMPSKSNKETGSTIDSHAFKMRVLNISLSLIFASMVTGCNEGTANTSAKSPDNPIAAYEATFQDSPPELVVMFEHTTQSLVKIKSGKPDDVLFKNYFAFNSPTYGLVACGQFGVKKEDALMWNTRGI